MGMTYEQVKTEYEGLLLELSPEQRAELLDYLTSASRFEFAPAFALVAYAPATVAAEVLLDPTVEAAWNVPMTVRLRKGADVWFSATLTYSGLVVDVTSFRHILNNANVTVTPAFRAALATYCGLPAFVQSVLPVEEGSSAFYIGVPETAPLRQFNNDHATEAHFEMTPVRLDESFYEAVTDGLFLEGLLPAAKQVNGAAAPETAVGDVTLAADEWTVELVTPAGVYAGPGVRVELPGWSSNNNFYTRYNHSDAVASRSVTLDRLRVVLASISPAGGGAGGGCDGDPASAQSALSTELTALGIPDVDFSAPETGELFCADADTFEAT